MQLAAKWTDITEKNREQIIVELQSLLERRKAGRIVFERTDGSTFSSWAAPMADGGFV